MNHTALQFQNNKKYNAESLKYVYKSSSPSLISVSSYRGIHFVNKMLKSIYLLSISFILFVVLFLYGTNADASTKQRDGKGGGFSFNICFFVNSAHEIIYLFIYFYPIFQCFPCSVL